MTADELLILRAEMLSIRAALTACPDASLPEVENRLDRVAETIANLDPVATKAEAALLRDIVRILGDLSALCEQATDFYGSWINTLGSLTGEYTGSGTTAFVPPSAARVAALG